VQIKKPAKPPTVVEVAIRETSGIYSDHRPDFLGSREAALDHIGLEPFTTTRNGIRSKVSRNGAYRSNAVQRKKRHIKFVREHQGDLFPPAA
jgi:hypothetical protein